MLTPSSIGSVVVLFWTSLKPAFYFRGRGYSSPPLNWGGFLFELREPWQGAVSISLSAAWAGQLGLRRGQGTLGPHLLLWLEAQRAEAHKGTPGGSCQLQKSPPAESRVTGV